MPEERIDPPTDSRDIVERLRDRLGLLQADGQVVLALLDEAADEIERLRDQSALARTAHTLTSGQL